MLRHDLTRDDLTPFRFRISARRRVKEVVGRRQVLGAAVEQLTERIEARLWHCSAAAAEPRSVPAQPDLTPACPPSSRPPDFRSVPFPSFASDPMCHLARQNGSSRIANASLRRLRDLGHALELGERPVGGVTAADRAAGIGLPRARAVNVSAGTRSGAMSW